MVRRQAAATARKRAPEVETDDSCDAIATVAQRFARDQLGMRAERVFVDRHDRSLVITITGVLPEAERAGAKERHIAELMVKTYTAAFRSISGVLAAACAAHVGEAVADTALLLDPASDCASIIVTFEQ